MLQHQHMSEARDAVRSAAVVPGSLAATALGYAAGLYIHNYQENARQQSYKAAAPDMRVKQDSAPASKSELTRDMIPVPGYGFQRYTETRELKNGITEYFVPVTGKWYRKGNK
jgi:hypothetical protein